MRRLEALLFEDVCVLPATQQSCSSAYIHLSLTGYHKDCSLVYTTLVCGHLGT